LRLHRGVFSIRAFVALAGVQQLEVGKAEPIPPAPSCLNMLLTAVPANKAAS
jgi:hypothetical protein